MIIYTILNILKLLLFISIILSSIITLKTLSFMIVEIYNYGECQIRDFEIISLLYTALIICIYLLSYMVYAVANITILSL